MFLFEPTENPPLVCVCVCFFVTVWVDASRKTIQVKFCFSPNLPKWEKSWNKSRAALHWSKSSRQFLCNTLQHKRQATSVFVCASRSVVSRGREKITMQTTWKQQYSTAIVCLDRTKAMLKEIPLAMTIIKPNHWCNLSYFISAVSAFDNGSFVLSCVSFILSRTWEICRVCVRRVWRNKSPWLNFLIDTHVILTLSDWRTQRWLSCWRRNATSSRWSSSWRSSTPLPSPVPSSLPNWDS